MPDRQIIRRTIRRQREQLSLKQQIDASNAINQYIATTAWFRRSRRIAFYQAVRGEVDPHLLMQRAWEMGKRCYLPVCHPLKSSLLFLPYSADDTLTPNRYGILEPSHCKRACLPYALDLVFVPLVAFDTDGNRLGSGKGYYDRTFAYLNRFPAGRRPLLIGLAYDFQQVAPIKPASWDVVLDDVVVC
jgi:5-formyltetrahydrofolate cyclo-ligase